MRGRSDGLPDWRDDAAYRALRALRLPGLAWEWLRRDPRYRCEALEALDGSEAATAEERAAAWGLHLFEDPRLAAPLARPIWRADHYPLVLEAKARAGAGADDLFDVQRFDGLARHVRSASGSEHLLLSDGIFDIRIDIVSGSLLEGPVKLCYRLGGLRSAEAPAAVLMRLLALGRTGSFARQLQPPVARMHRFLLELRVQDAIVAGADQREIAAALVSSEAAAPKWRIEAPTARSRVQRLVRRARQMQKGGYRRLLR
ncbi:MAG: DUF2285 domain-containing protein [Alphaproteobacteria bacterium]|nr:MAG: DUF2285 domain-containing protein [Alphaproteobacteria bacterium]